MRVHHLSCANMFPPLMSPIVCHVLLCETDEGLALVDSGLGTVDYAKPSRMGPARFLTRPVRDEADTALRQVEALGYSRDDIKNIVLTHMDFDHIGGIADFPDATVHTTAEEYDWAVVNPDFTSKQRYRQQQWDHGPKITTHAGPGEQWRFGLTGTEVLPGITMIPMPGHTKGHAAVAVDAGDRGLLIHAGDSVFDASVYTATSPSGKPLEKIGKLRAFEKVMAVNRKAIAGNHATLGRLQKEDGVTVFPAHDKRIFDELKDS
ncbi:MAG: MBL fold metallo-hydrolase [Aeromicrobium sp.]